MASGFSQKKPSSSNPDSRNKPPQEDKLTWDPTVAAVGKWRMEDDGTTLDSYDPDYKGETRNLPTLAGFRLTRKDTVEWKLHVQIQPEDMDPQVCREFTFEIGANDYRTERNIQISKENTTNVKYHFDFNGRGSTLYEFLEDGSRKATQVKFSYGLVWFDVDLFEARECAKRVRLHLETVHKTVEEDVKDESSEMVFDRDAERLLASVRKWVRPRPGHT